MMTKTIPKKKHIVPRIRSRRVNNVMVRFTPIAKHKPAKNNVFPIAINDASNRSTTPNVTNPKPKQISPIPIFWLSSSTILS